MNNTELNTYLPGAAVDRVNNLLREARVEVRVKNARVTRHGDYRKLPNGKHLITINNNLNNYRFLLTLLHELAHHRAFEEYGRSIKPHGKEWKNCFREIALPFLNPEVFPKGLLPALASHFKNPRASSDSDSVLSLALKLLDPPNNKNFIFEIPLGEAFRLYNGRIFKRGAKRTKRYECVEIATGRTYLFNPNAEVELLNRIDE